MTTSVDRTNDELHSDIDAFLLKISAGDTVVMFLDGHGLQYRGDNFFAPVDYLTSAGPPDPKRHALAIYEKIIEPLTRKRTRLNFVAVDACRSEHVPTGCGATQRRTCKSCFPPVSSPRLTASNTSAYAPGMPFGSGTVLSLACEPGKSAYDGAHRPSGLSWYAEALVKYMGHPDDITRVVDYINTSVREASEGEQIPSVSFAFRECPLLLCQPLSQSQ